MKFPLFVIGLAALVPVALILTPGAEEESDHAPIGTPIIWTVAPTPPPTPLPRHEASLLRLSWPGGVDAIFTPTPTPQPLAPVEVTPAYIPSGSTEAIFLAGWRDGGGGSLKDAPAVHRFIDCESTWRVVTDGKHLGLSQFLPATWGHVAGLTGYWNVYDPYEHAFNTAYWALISDPYQQWPVCWRR